MTAERESQRDTGWFSVCVDTNISIKISLSLLYNTSVALLKNSVSVVFVFLEIFFGRKFVMLITCNLRRKLIRVGK